jgi:streptogramin lyase
MRLTLVASALGVAVSCGDATAHPGNGVAVTAEGVVYFSDVEQNVIWKVDEKGELSALTRGLHSHSIAMDTAGDVWAEHLRYVPSKPEGQEWERTLLRIAPTGEQRIVLGPTFGTDAFGGSPFTCDASGAIVSLAQRPVGRYFLQRITTEGKVEPLEVGHQDPVAGEAPLPGTISGICATPGGGFVVTQGMLVLRMHGASSAKVMASLWERQLPADAMSVRVHALWGVACDETASFVYVTDWDARTVHKVQEDGTFTTFARSPAPWSPTGVAVRGERVYVLEHGLEGDQNLGPRVRVINAAGGDGRVIATVE